MRAGRRTVEVGLVSLLLLGCLATVTVTNVEGPDGSDGEVATIVGREFGLPFDLRRAMCQAAMSG